MQEESPDELVCREGHGLLLIVVAVISPGEFHFTAFDIDDPMIGDGHPVRVAADVVHHLLWSGEGRFSVDDPFQVSHRIQMAVESLRVSSASSEEKNRNLPESKASCRYVKNNRRNRRDSTRTGKKKRGRQEIHRVPSREIPPPGTTQWRWG